MVLAFEDEADKAFSSVSGRFFEIYSFSESNPMVNLDNECCIGCGACADLCPDVFEMDDRINKARVIVFEVRDRGCVEEAITICPVECITWDK